MATKDVKLASSDTPKAGSTETPISETDKPLVAPERWTADRKELFSKQPKEVQEAWLAQHKDWETGYGKKFEEIAQVKKSYDEIQSQFTPEIKTQMQEAGLNEAQTVAKLLSYQRQFMTNPAAYIKGLLDHTGIDPRIFLQSQDSQNSGQYQALAPVLAPLMNEINELKAYRNAEERQKAEAAESHAFETLSQLIQETSDDGSLKFPHVERVANIMADLIENDPRFSAMAPREQFEQAYNVAVYMDPSIREELISAEVSKRAEALSSESQKTRLKAAATSKPRSGATAPIPRPKGIRGAYEAAQKQVGSR